MMFRSLQQGLTNALIIVKMTSIIKLKIDINYWRR